MVEDARQRTYTWLTTYILDANLTKDNDSTEASWICCFEEPPYPLKRVFFDPKNVDLVFTTGTPTTKTAVDFDGSIYSYEESVPIIIQTVTKQGITGNELRWKAEAELRRIIETYPLGSYRSISSSGPYDQFLGKTKLYGIKIMLTYSRDVT